MFSLSLLMIAMSAATVSCVRLNLIGDRTPFVYDRPDSSLDLLDVIRSEEPSYLIMTYSITNDLHISSWDEVLEKYDTAQLDGFIHVQFKRNDEEGEKLDEDVVAPTIPLDKILESDKNVEIPTQTTYIDPNSKPGSPTVIVRYSEDKPFSLYRATIFDESIEGKALSEISLKIEVSLEAYKKDDQLMIRALYRFSPSIFMTNSGMHVELEPHSSLVFYEK